MSVYIALLALGGIAATIWKFTKANGNLIERAIDASIYLSFTALAIMLLGRIVQLANIDWIEAKIAPAIAMTRGYSLFQDPQMGVMTAWIYGPVGAIAVLPAALAQRPTTARIIGSSISAFCSIAPAIWLLGMAAKSRASRAVAVSAVLVFGWMLIYAEDLGRCASMPGADAPAIALAICACAFIWRKRTITSLCLSALCAILCIWTKQTFAPIVFGLVFYVFISSSPKIAAIYSTILLASGLVISALICLSFGASNLWFHMVTIPSRHPFADAQAGTFAVFGKGIVDLLLTCEISLALLGLVLVLDAAVRDPAASFSQWLATRRYSLLLIIAVCATPGSLLGYLKISGYLNNLGCVDHLILLAAMVGAVETCANLKTSHVGAIEGLVSRGLAIFALALAATTTLSETNGLRADWPALAHPYQNVEEQTFDYAKQHPHEVYCPWNPLITLLAENELYHFEWGLIDRVHARLMPSEQQYAAHLPAKMNKIVFLSEPTSIATLTAIPSFDKRIQVPQLPGCVVYVQQAN